MWRVGDKVVIIRGRKGDSDFKIGAEGTVISKGLGITLPVLVETNETKRRAWFSSSGDLLVCNGIICERVRKRKNNYY